MSQLFCIICKKNKQIFCSIDQLEAHIAESHLALFPFSCMLCEYGGRYPTEATIMAHMRACHQIEDEFKFYAIFNKETIEQRKKATDMLQRCLAGDGKAVTDEQEQNSSTTTDGQQIRIMESEVIQPQKASQSPRKKKNSEEPDKAISATFDSVFATPESLPRPAKIPRLQPPSVPNNNRPVSVPPAVQTQLPEVNKDSEYNQIPSVVRQALLPKIGVSHSLAENNQNQKSTMSAIREKKKAEASNSNGLKRMRKEEKKNTEKKISETAAKGGYTGFDIDRLLGDPKTDQNIDATDVEHSEGDPSKEKVAKICRGMQQDLESAPTFFTSKTSTKLGLVLLRAESEGREFQTKNSRGHQSVQKEIRGDSNLDKRLEGFVKRQGELGSKRVEHEQYREIKQELELKIKQRDKELEERGMKKTKKSRKDKEN